MHTLADSGRMRVVGKVAEMVRSAVGNSNSDLHYGALTTEIRSIKKGSPQLPFS